MIETGGAAIPQIAGIENLSKFLELVSTPWQGAPGGVWNRLALIRGSQGAAGAPVTPWVAVDAVVATTQENVGGDGWTAILVRPSVADDSRYRLVLSGGGADAFRLPFNDVVPPVAGSRTGDYKPLATSIAAWVRKQAAGDATHARQWVLGFAAYEVDVSSRLTARIGLHGDGVSGFRFGSLNCPDAAIVGNNAATDIDPGSVQPAELVSPGASWFHVRVKAIPATPALRGRWACYLNGRLVKTFTDVSNFPRSSGNNAARKYAGFNAGFGIWFDAAQIQGYFLYDLRLTLTDDLSV